MDKPVERMPKKPYTPPAVTVYGTVRELTLHQGRHGGRDNPPRTPTRNRTGLP
jgi:hypothetical protein